MNRVIIQITTNVLNGNIIIHALCNDGTLWYQKCYPATGKYEWHLDTQIPQDEVKPSPERVTADTKTEINRP